MTILRGGLTALISMLLLAAAITAARAQETAAGAPRRIVSLNLCTDQLLVDLVPRERIAAVSFLATDRSLSAAASSLRGFKQVKGTAEEVLALNPDLVIAGEYTTGPTVDLLKRLGVNVLVVPLASDFEGMKQTLRTLGTATGTQERAQAMIADFDERIRSARSLVPARPTAVAYQVNSLASGAGTLLDAALDAAGFHNIARAAKLGPAGRLPLEELVAAPPDLIVLANAPDEFKTVLADNLRHPAFRALLDKRPHVHLPMPMWMCATPRIADAVELLASMKRTGLAHARPEPESRRP
jgi:iron complex transport system substrate-binding protein